jgi:hypothetical protein
VLCDTGHQNDKGIFHQYTFSTFRNSAGSVGKKNGDQIEYTEEKKKEEQVGHNEG